jgi:hypothetical protein
MQPTFKSYSKSNSLCWIGDGESHTLSSTNHSAYKALSISSQSAWTDHNPTLECRNQQHWVTWEQKKKKS